MRNQSEELIVVKRKGRGKGHGGGGAWKVAFADFMLALMSLFLILWILAVSSQQEREVLSQRLRDYSILSNEANPFDISNSPFPIDLEGKPSVEELVTLQYITEGQKEQQNNLLHQANGTKLSQAVENKALKGFISTPEQMKKVSNTISNMVNIIGLEKNVQVDVVPQGLRIQIKDTDNKPMYARGSRFITPPFQQLLTVLTPVLSQFTNRLMISGHTDSVPFPDDHYTNWELSADRAGMARQVMVSDGLPADHVAMVMGLADTQLANAEKPDASENRRIEILLLNEKAETDLQHMFSQPAHKMDLPTPPPLLTPLPQHGHENARTNQNN